MGVYVFIVAAVVILGFLMPQRGPRRKLYIALIAALHTFVCGFRYMYLTGDLRKYAAIYYELPNLGWFGDGVWNEGRNFGFFWFEKVFSQLTDGNFQVYLFVVALIIEIALAFLIFRYSPRPWLSYLIWNCLSFYLLGFSALKQALAMGILMLAMICILEDKLFPFLFLTLIAGAVHMPALIFLPAYWIAKRKVNANTVIIYVGIGVLMYYFRSQFVAFISELYYEEDEFILSSNRLGGRFFMIVVVVLCGIVLKGFQDRDYAKLFHMMAMAAIFQMLSGFDNVFTRLTDYFFQFSVLYIPMTFSRYAVSPKLDRGGARAMFPFHERSLTLFAVLVALVLLWFYYTYNLNITISYEPDNYLNFRFMWDVAV